MHSKKGICWSSKGASRHFWRARTTFQTARASCRYETKTTTRRRMSIKLSKKKAKLKPSSPCWTCTDSSSRKSLQRDRKQDHSRKTILIKPGVIQKPIRDRKSSSLLCGMTQNHSNKRWPVDRTRSTKSVCNGTDRFVSSSVWTRSRRWT